MRVIVDDPALGQITYDENPFTDRRTLFINGERAVKQKKKTYTYNNGEVMVSAVLRGNFFTGVTLQVGDRTVVLARPMYWYEAVLGFLPAICIIWANVSPIYLIPGIPVIGGGIGGFLSGLMAVISLAYVKEIKNIFAKIAFGLAMVAANLLLGTICTFLVLCLYAIS